MVPTPTSRSSAASSQVGILRCNVVLPNGKSVRVPISEDAALSELHEAAILRGSATALSFPYTVQSTALKLGGQDAAYLWNQDKISDVLDDAGTHTFHLVAFETTASTSAPGPSRKQGSALVGTPASSANLLSFSSSNSEIVNVRICWVVPETAIATGRTINSLPTERDTLPLTTTVAELEDMAARKLSTLQAATGQLPTGTTPSMYTRYSHLSNSQLKDVSLASLGLVTSAISPLTIFLVPTRPSSNDIKDALGFKTSDRALATFVTSLHLFIAKVAQNSQKLNNFLETLWELTHFPPALIALRQMVLDKEILPQPCAVFAACFRELCLQIAPRSVHGSQDDVLLVSRHIFSWLCSLRSHSSTILKSSHSIVHAVELRRPASPARLSTIGKPTHDMVTNTPGLNPFPGANAASDGQNIQQLVVCKERPDNVSSEMLALALNEGKDGIIRCYFDLPANFDGFEVHPRRKLLETKDFINLLHTINQDEMFRMVGPFQLSQCPSVSLPVVTLDTLGYVSLYERKDFNCGERYTSTWNIIKGEEKLPAAEPGHHLYQMLEPLMVERKKSGTWQIDAWEEGKAGTFGGPPYEAIVVCVDTSGSMSTSMPQAWFENYAAAKVDGEELSRINEVKEFFKNFMVRLNAYRVSTDIGLVTFAKRDDVKTRQSLTRVVLDLQHALDRVKTGSLTALWDGIRRSCEMLVEHKTKHPGVKLRIIALTDGVNNDSVAAPSDVCAELYKHNIVLDAIVIDTSTTSDLFKIARHTGGYAFYPQDRTALFQIFLLENFVDIRTRPDIVKVPIDDYSLSIPKSADLRTMFDLPPCRPHENQNDHFIALADAALFLRRVHRSASSPRSRRSNSTSSVSSSVVSGATRILLDQVQDAISHNHDYIDIYVSENNMGFWKVVMQGRPDTPYENGTFLAYLEVGDSYPSKPPTMRFITPILHPNVSKHGRICHHIFDRSWDPDFSIMQVIQHVWDILVLVESADAIDPISALRFYTDQQSAERLVKAYITRFAMKSRDEHRFEICGPESDVPSVDSRRSNSVISLSSTTSSSWQSIGSQANPSNLSTTQLTASALNDLQRQQANLRNPAHRNPSLLGRPRNTSSTSQSMHVVNTPPTGQTPTSTAGGGPGQIPSTNTPSSSSPANSSSTPELLLPTGGPGNMGSSRHSNTAMLPVRNPFLTPPAASSATLPVSRRASFFRKLRTSSGNT